MDSAACIELRSPARWLGRIRSDRIAITYWFTQAKVLWALFEIGGLAMAFADSLSIAVFRNAAPRVGPGFWQQRFLVVGSVALYWRRVQRWICWPVDVVDPIANLDCADHYRSCRGAPYVLATGSDHSAGSSGRLLAAPGALSKTGFRPQAALQSSRCP